VVTLGAPSVGDAKAVHALVGACQPLDLNSTYAYTMFESMAEGQLRHPDHRFEWTRAEFQAWVDSVTARFPYSATIEPLGDVDAALGAPSQMAIFERRTS
jgi:hypothetical protein